LKIKHREDYAQKRREAYPDLADQMDAMVKMAEALQRQGLAIPPETQSVIDRCRAVKKRFPKN